MNDVRGDSSKKPESKSKRSGTSPQRTSHWKSQKRRKRSTSVSRQLAPTVKKSNSLSNLDKSRTPCSAKSVSTNRKPRIRSADPYLHNDESPQANMNRPLRKSRIIKRGSPIPFPENTPRPLSNTKADNSRPTSRPPSAMEFQWNTHESMKTSFFTLSSGNDSKSDDKVDEAEKTVNLCGTYKRTSIKKLVPGCNAPSRGQSPVNKIETVGTKRALSKSRSPEPVTNLKCTKKSADSKRRSKSPMETSNMRSPSGIRAQVVRQTNTKPFREPSQHTLNTSTASGVSQSTKSPVKSWVWYTEESRSPSRNTNTTLSPGVDKEKMLEKMLLDAMKYSLRANQTIGREKSKVKTTGSPEKLREIKVSQPSPQSFKPPHSPGTAMKRDNKIGDTQGISMGDVSLLLKHRYCAGSPTSNETCLSESRNGSSYSGLDTLSPPSKLTYFSSGSTEDSEISRSTTSVSQESLFIRLQRDIKKMTPHAKNTLNVSQKVATSTKILQKAKEAPLYVENEQIFQPSVIYAPPMPYTNSTASVSVSKLSNANMASTSDKSAVNQEETSMSTLTVSCPVFEFNKSKKVVDLPVMPRRKPVVKPWIPFTYKRQIYNFKNGVIAVSSRNDDQKKTHKNCGLSLISLKRNEPSTQENVGSAVDNTGNKMVPKKEGYLTKKKSDSSAVCHFRRKHSNLNRNKEIVKQQTRLENTIHQSDLMAKKSPDREERPSEEKHLPHKRRARQKYVRAKSDISVKPENSFPSEKTSRATTPTTKIKIDKPQEYDTKAEQKFASKQISSTATKSTTASSIYQTSFRKIRNSPIFHQLIRTLVEQFSKIRLPSRHNVHGVSSKPASGRATPTKIRSKKVLPPCHDVAVAADLPLEINPLANAFTNTSDSIEALTFLGESKMSGQRKIKIRVSVNPSRKKVGNISYRESLLSDNDQDRLSTLRELSQQESPYTDVTLLEQERLFQAVPDTNTRTSSPRTCVKRSTGQNLSPELKPVQQPIVSSVYSQVTPDNVKELTGFYTFYTENDEESKKKEEKCSSQTREQDVPVSTTSWEDAVEASRRPTPNKITTPMRHAVLKKGFERKRSLSRRLHPLLREPNMRTLIRFIPITLLVLSFFYIVRVISNLPQRHH